MSATGRKARAAEPLTSIDDTATTEALVVDRVANDEETATRQFVTFVIGSEMFAVDVAPVQEIIRVPSMVRVPLAPSTLDGLANLRGRVLPIVSLRRVFGFDERPHDDATRALVIDLGQPLGFVVDRVVSVVSVEPNQIEGVGSIEATVDTTMLAGILKDVCGHDVTMVLNFGDLIAREFASASVRTAREASRATETTDDPDKTDDDLLQSDELQLVSFNIADQEYAIAIENVQEIVQVPAHIVLVPNSAPHVLGVMTLRERVLPLVALRRIFGLPAQGVDERSRVVVLAVGDTFVGVVTDSVNEVLRVARSTVDPMPSLLADTSRKGEISQLCQLDGGKRIVSIIDAEKLFDLSSLQEALLAPASVSARADSAGSTLEQPDDDDEQVVVFRLDREEFGVPIGSVQEIVRLPDELTRVPKTPDFVEGIINLRGSVLPVIDLRLRLGLDRAERSDRQRVMVFLLDGARTGFVVDSVAEVLRIAHSSIAATPRLSGGNSELLARTANLPGVNRMVQLLAPDHLLDGHDMTALSKLAA